MSLLTGRTPVLPLGALPRVDLLPPSEVRRRDMLSRARTWVYIGIGALAVAVLAVGAAFAYNMAATVRLALEQSRTQQILIGIAELSDVSAALSLRAELTQTGGEAMAGDLTWSQVVDVVDARLPPGTTIIDYDLLAGPVPEATATVPPAPGATGTVTVTSVQPLDFVTMTQRLRTIETVQVIEVDDLSSEDDDPLYEYRIRFTVDQSVYTTAPTAES
jgi:hypothetical protein